MEASADRAHRGPAALAAKQDDGGSGDVAGAGVRDRDARDCARRRIDVGYGRGARAVTGDVNGRGNEIARTARANRDTADSVARSSQERLVDRYGLSVGVDRAALVDDGCAIGAVVVQGDEIAQLPIVGARVDLQGAAVEVEPGLAAGAAGAADDLPRIERASAEIVCALEIAFRPSVT